MLSDILLVLFWTAVRVINGMTIEEELDGGVLISWGRNGLVVPIFVLTSLVSLDITDKVVLHDAEDQEEPKEVDGLQGGEKTESYSL
jgi:hypothetical protein